MVIVLLMLLASCSHPDGDNGVKEAVEGVQEVLVTQEDVAIADPIKERVDKMEIEDKIAELFLVNLEGDKEFRPVEYLGKKPLVPGGYLFFSYNVSSDKEVFKSFVSSVKGFSESVPYIAIDQEGGYVARLRGLTPTLPSQYRVAHECDKEGARLLYEEQARWMKELGIDLNLAPVVEVANEGNKDFLGSRSYGTREDVIAYAICAIKAYEDEGVATCLKHFPGNNNADPHTLLPRLDLTKATLDDDIVGVIKALLPLSPEAVLMSHAVVSVDGVGDGVPASISKDWVKVLREDCGFNGLIISDDIFMAALEQNGFPPKKAIPLALKAGINVLMLSEKKFASYIELIKDCIDADPSLIDKIDDSVYRVLSFKVRHALESL